MTILDQQGKLFGCWNIIDVAVGIFMVLAVLGVFLVQSGTHETSGQMVTGETDIRVTVHIPGLTTLDTQMLVPGEKTAITIRNQPRGDVLIEKVDYTPVQLTLMSPHGQPAVVTDLAQPHGYNLLVQLRDHAKISKEGYVTEGVKVKVGLPIELEGFKYRLYGRIANVEPLE